MPLNLGDFLFITQPSVPTLLSLSSHSPLIADQLMFVAPQQEGQSEGAEAPLKTILVWGGMAQWGGVRGGRSGPAFISILSI